MCGGGGDDWCKRAFRVGGGGKWVSDVLYSSALLQRDEMAKAMRCSGSVDTVAIHNHAVANNMSWLDALGQLLFCCICSLRAGARAVPRAWHGFRAGV